jgi:hypothetical protein
MAIGLPRQSLGKRLAKVFLPVLIALNVPFVYIQIDSLLNPVDLNSAAKGAMLGYWVFDYVLIPVGLVILFVIQRVIIIPIWNRQLIKSRYVLLSSLCIGIILSNLFGALGGYLVWVGQPGAADLINSVLLMSCFAVIYCLINTITLYLLDRSYIKSLKPHKLQSN